MIENYKPIPVVGKRYNCFDDGKISESRRYEVEITKVHEFKDMPEDAKWLWENNLWYEDMLERDDDSYHLFAFPDDQDYIIESISYEIKDKPETCYFARTSWGGWFGLGRKSINYDSGESWCDSMWCSGTLDVDGELWDRYLEFLQK